MMKIFFRIALFSACFMCSNSWFIPTSGTAVSLDTETSKTAVGADAECCIQDEWEGLIYLDNGHVFIDEHTHEHTLIAYLNGTMHVAYSVQEAKFYYEVLVFEQNSFKPKPHIVHFANLLDYNMGISYFMSYGHYRNFSLPKHMTKACIPADATLLSRGKFTDPAKVTETYQFLQYNQGVPIQITATVLRSVSQEDNQAVCEPFYASYLMRINHTDSGDLHILNVMDRGPIKSKHIFDVPKECQHL